MTQDAHAQEQQRLRTERGLSMLASTAIRFEPDGRHAWHATDSEGGSHLVSLDHCNCEDFTRRGTNNGLRCKHMEALRISLSALGAEPGVARPDTLMQRLSAPFTPEAVHWKPQRVDAQGKRALAVPYLDAREVAQRLDEVLGPLGWQVAHEMVGDQVVTGVGIRDPNLGSWTWKWDSGFVGRVGNDDEKEPGEAASRRRAEDEETSRKGTLSDGLKRAAVLWGVGRYLYRVPRMWVDYDPKSRSLLQTPRLPPWAQPAKEDDRPRKSPPAPHAPSAAGTHEPRAESAPSPQIDANAPDSGAQQK